MDSTTTQVITLDHVSKKPALVSVIFSLLLILLFVAAIGLGAGFVYGQIRSNAPSLVLQKGGQVTNDKDGNKVFKDNANNYQITFPKDFNVSEKKGSVTGVNALKGANSFELWLSVDQPVDFNNEQKASITSTNKDVAIEVNKETASMTEYIYKNGTIFSVVILTSTNSHPQVTFWLKGGNSNEYDGLKQLLQKFSFN